MSSALQIAIQLAVPLVAPAIPVVTRWILYRSESGHSQDGAQQVPRPPSLPVKEPGALQVENRLVLSVGLAIAAWAVLVTLSSLSFFPAVTTEERLVIGLSITLVASVMCVAAWRLGLMLLLSSLWCLSAPIATSISLLMSEGEPGLPILSCCMLMAVSVAATTHFLGSPIRSNAAESKIPAAWVHPARRATWCLIALTALLLIVGYGADTARRLEKLPYVTRHHIHGDARTVLQDVSRMDDAGLINFFALASEITASVEYERHFRESNSARALQDPRLLLNVGVAERSIAQDSARREGDSDSGVVPGSEGGEDTDQAEESRTERLLRVAAELQPFSAPIVYGPMSEEKKTDLIHRRAKFIHNADPRAPGVRRSRVGAFSVAGRARRGFNRGALSWPADVRGLHAGETYWIDGAAYQFTGRIDGDGDPWFVDSFGNETYIPRRRLPEYSADIDRDTIATWADPIVANALRSQLNRPAYEESSVAFWQYLEHAISACDNKEKAREAAVRLYSLSAAQLTSVQAYIIGPMSGSVDADRGPAQRLLEIVAAVELESSQREEMAEQPSKAIEAFVYNPSSRSDSIKSNRIFTDLATAMSPLSADWAALLKEGVGEIARLFDRDVIEVAKILAVLARADEGDIAKIGRPVQEVMTSSADSATRALLRRFERLPDDAQEAVLNEIGLSRLFEVLPALATPEFHFARAYSSDAGFAWAIMIGIGLLVSIPLYWFGVSLSHLLRLRDRKVSKIRISIAAKSASDRVPIDAPDPALQFVGRTAALEWSSRIARRGYGTVGVVGRRGVGKTRLLRAILEGPAVNDQPVQHLGVWVSVPTEFDEKTFVRSLRFALASRVESVMASRLGALPLQAREGLSELRVAELIGFVVVMTIAALSWTEVASIMGLESGVAFTWPWILLSASAVCFLINYTSLPGLNPFADYHAMGVGRDSVQTLKARALYSRAVTILGQSSDLDRGPRRSWVALAASAFFAVVAAIEFEAESRASSIFFAGLALSMFFWWHLRSRTVGRPMFSRSTTVTAQIQEYREFARSVTKYASIEAPVETRVVICLDELDKVVGIEETRVFLRQMKALFEIKGVYYFVSLAEDAYRAMIRGGHDGKNEVDSAVDHIYFLGHLSLEEVRAILESYMSKAGAPDLDRVTQGQLVWVACVLSAGVPRDALRILDRWVVSSETQSGLCVNEFALSEIRPVLDLVRMEDSALDRAFAPVEVDAAAILLHCNHRLGDWKERSATEDRREVGPDIARALVRLVCVAGFLEVLRGGANVASSARVLMDSMYQVPSAPLERLLGAELDRIRDVVAVRSV